MADNNGGRSRQAPALPRDLDTEARAASLEPPTYVRQRGQHVVTDAERNGLRELEAAAADIRNRSTAAGSVAMSPAMLKAVEDVVQRKDLIRDIADTAAMLTYGEMKEWVKQIVDEMPSTEPVTKEQLLNMLPDMMLAWFTKKIEASLDQAAPKKTAVAVVA